MRPKHIYKCYTCNIQQTDMPKCSALGHNIKTLRVARDGTIMGNMFEDND